MGSLLFGLTYLVVVISVLTGFIKLAASENQVLKVLHKSCGPLSNFLYGLYFVLFQFQTSYPAQRIALTLAFILMIYTGLVTAKPELTGKRKSTHITLGIVNLILFSFIFFSFFLLG